MADVSASRAARTQNAFRFPARRLLLSRTDQQQLAMCWCATITAILRRGGTRLERDRYIACLQAVTGGAHCERAPGTPRAVEITERNHMLNVN
jgi:hypothetical protein